MMNCMKRLAFTCIIALFFHPLYAQDLFDVSNPLWEPQDDRVFLQEVSSRIPTEEPVFSVAQAKGDCFALVGANVFRVEPDGSLKQDDYAPEGVSDLKSENGWIWALSMEGIYLYRRGEWKKMGNQRYVDVCMHNGKVHAATQEEIFRFEGDEFVSIKPEGGYHSSDMTQVMEDGTQIHPTPVRLGPVTALQPYSGTLYVLRPGELVYFDGKVVNEDFVDWGSLPSRNTRDMLRFGNRLLISTDRGLGVLRGASLNALKGADGLPVENTTCLEKGFDNDVWIGTQRGAVRMLKNDWHYFGADLWLPGNNVHDIAVGDGIVYIATGKGLGIIRYEPFTLRKKADYFERHLDEWGHKRLGFIHTLYKKEGEWVREISDNDGGHTSPYLAAMSYKYACTGDETAREEAVNSFKAMCWLERIVPIDGFFARAIWSTTADKDDKSKHGSGGLPAKWYPTPDGKWFWKGDTSSDEVIAQFYSVSLFYELVAEGKDKEEARKLLSRIASYIIDCGWVLKDMDGETTRWGRWNPGYLLRPYGYVDRGINGLEALTFMETAYSITGDDKFKKGLQQLIEWGYPENTLRQKNVFPPENIAKWDDNHAFRSYNTLLRYVDDPTLRSVYLRSLERTWEVKRMEQIPWFNYIYGIITGNNCESANAAKHLREWVLDCVEHDVENSHRDDLFIEAGYTSYEGGEKRISPREMHVMRSHRSAIVLDSGRGGKRVMEPTGFLRDYWMGRYHGFIEAPTTANPELISVEKGRSKQLGAEPYNGPPRPELY